MKKNYVGMKAIGFSLALVVFRFWGFGIVFSR